MVRQTDRQTDRQTETKQVRIDVVLGLFVSLSLNYCVAKNILEKRERERERERVCVCVWPEKGGGGGGGGQGEGQINYECPVLHGKKEAHTSDRWKEKQQIKIPF